MHNVPDNPLPGAWDFVQSLGLRACLGHYKLPCLPTLERGHVLSWFPKFSTVLPFCLPLFVLLPPYLSRTNCL